MSKWVGQLIDGLICLLWLSLPCWSEGVAADCLEGQNEDVSIHAQGAPLAEVLATLTLPEQCAMALANGLRGSVSLWLDHVGWFEALAVIAWQQRLLLRRFPHVVAIASSGSGAKTLASPMVYRRLNLRFITAEECMVRLSKQAKGLLSPEGRLVVDEGGHGVLIYEHIDRVSAVLAFIHALDRSVPQVKIMARIVYVHEDFASQFGLNWRSDNQDLISFDPSVVVHAPWSILGAKLRWYQRRGKATIVAEPRIVVQAGKEAWIESGEQIPYQERAGSERVSLTFKKAVLQLKVKPSLLVNNQIHMMLGLKQDQVSADLLQGAPLIQTQNLQTEVVVASGETLILGGVYRQIRDKAYQGLPWWQHSRFLRYVLGYQRRKNQHQQLLVFITPVVLGGK